MTTSTSKPLLALLLCACMLNGCNDNPDSPANLDASGLDPASRPPVREGVLGPLPVKQVQIKNETFTLEIADDDAERQQGLMYRKAMPARHGMLFAWPTLQPRLDFWMKDTEVPLDLIYLDQSGKIVAIMTGRPFDRSPIPCDSPCQFVIELNHGTANQINLKLGDVIELPNLQP